MQPVSEMQWEWAWSPVTCSARNAVVCTAEETSVQNSSFRPPGDFTMRFLPQRFSWSYFPGAQIFPHFFPLPPVPLQPGIDTGSQPQLLWVYQCKTPTWTLPLTHHHAPSSYAPARYWPDSHHQPPLPCVHSWQDPAAMEVHADSQGPHNWQRAGFNPIFYLWPAYPMCS